jgi:ATP/ADP translocase/HEAT repeat protein
MQALLLRLFALADEDWRVLWLLGPLFGVATASSVIVASFTKALFLSANELSAMPWMFLGSSGFTAVASVLYVMAMERMALRARFQSLLAAAVVTFVLLRLAYPLNEAAMSLAIYVWCTGIGHLILIQMWNMSSGMLPARQAKRLFPVFAAIATLGAATGGGLVQAALSLSMPAHDLVWVSVVLLVYPLGAIPRVVRELEGALPPGVDEARGRRRGARVKSDSEVVRGVRSIVESPLLSRLALFVFMMQIASVLLDYQYSGELKVRFAKDELAGFLGRYYAASNLIAFAFALFASSRVVRAVGLGVSIAASAIFIAAGCGAYLLVGLGVLGAAGFWTVVVASFLERIASFALSRNAMQMLVTPIETKRGERAKTLIDGVVYRGATILVSVVLLVAGPSAAQMIWLSPFAIAASFLVIVVALRIGPHYRRTLFEALQARRLDTSADPQLRSWLQQTAIKEAEQRLRSDDDEQVVKSLELLRDMKLNTRPETLSALLERPNTDVVRRTLETMNTLGMVASLEALLPQLRFDNDPVVLREVLRMFEHYPNPDLLPRVRYYASHEDAGVASLAVIWLKKVAGYKSTMDIQNDLAADIHSDDDDRRARAAEMAGRTRWNQATRELPLMIDDPSLAVRLNAVEAMGQVGIPDYIDPLIVALGRGDLSDRARAALMRYGESLIAEIVERLRDSEVNLATRTRLIGVVEGIGGRAAVELLMGAAMTDGQAMRNQAVLSLWRMARDPDQPTPPRTWLVERADEEIRRLETYARVRAHVHGLGVRRQFFLTELDAMRWQAETRVFRLLGLLYPRTAMYRAYLHYRSDVRRVRSNAIELLDQHVRDPELRRFVNLVEMALDATVRLPAVGRGLDGADAQVAKLLANDTPWLQRVWQWVCIGEVRLTFSDDGVLDVVTDPMDIVFLLKSVPLFAGLSGEQLLPVADIVQRVDYEKGQVVFEQGQPGSHVYLVLEGSVEVLHDGERVAVLGAKECFGEMALLDSGARSASIRTLEDTSLWAIAREDFQDLLDLHPALAKGVIRVLTHRLRDATDQQASGGDAKAA